MDKDLVRQQLIDSGDFVRIDEATGIVVVKGVKHKYSKDSILLCFSVCLVNPWFALTQTGERLIWCEGDSPKCETREEAEQYYQNRIKGYNPEFLE